NLMNYGKPFFAEKRRKNASNVVLPLLKNVEKKDSKIEKTGSCNKVNHDKTGRKELKTRINLQMMKKQKKIRLKNFGKIIVMLSLTGLIFQSCSVKKYIPEDEKLYTGAKIEIESDSVIQHEKQLKVVLDEALRPKPNKSFLGMRLGLYFYYKMQKENPGFINKFLYKKIGEKPVYLSDVETFEVKEILLNRLENRGFFYSAASHEIHEKDKTASIDYSLSVRAPYRMENYKIDSLPQPIASAIKESVDKTQFKSGVRFDLNYMKQERQRIDNDLKMDGYYNFN